MRIKRSSRKNMINSEQENMKEHLSNSMIKKKCSLSNSNYSIVQIQVKEEEKENEPVPTLISSDENKPILNFSKNSSDNGMSNTSKSIRNVLDSEGGQADAENLPVPDVDACQNGQPNAENRPVPNVDACQGNQVNGRGQKRSPDEETNDLIKNSSNMEINELKKKYIRLEETLETLQERSIPRPDDPNVIRFLVDLGNKLANTSPRESTFNDTKQELLNMIGVEECDINPRNKKTPTGLARCLIRMKYPNPDSYTGFAQVDELHVQTIIGYVKCCFPFSNKSSSELRRAMNNYFSCYSFHHR